MAQTWQMDGCHLNTRQNKSQNSVAWSKPEDRGLYQIKCIVDAANFQNHAMGAGFIIRDQNGQVIWCGRWQLGGSVRPSPAEALAAKGVLQKISPLNLHN